MLRVIDAWTSCRDMTHSINDTEIETMIGRQYSTRNDLLRAANQLVDTLGHGIVTYIDEVSKKIYVFQCDLKLYRNLRSDKDGVSL